MIVQVDPASLEQAAGVATAGGQAGADQQVDQPDAFTGKLCFRYLAGRHILEDVGHFRCAQPFHLPAEEHLGGFLRCCQGSLIMHHTSDFPGEGALRFTSFRLAFHRFRQGIDLRLIQPGEEAQVLDHVSVVGVEEELVEAIRGSPFRIHPHRTGFGLAELHPAGGSDQRRDDTMRLAGTQTADQILPGHDVAPLVAAPHLQGAVVAIVEHQKVVGLQQHVAKFGEGDAVFRLDPPLHRLLGEHAVDGEVFADITQEIDVTDSAQPIVIIDDGRRIRFGVKIQEARQLFADAGKIFFGLLFGEHLALGGLAAGIADQTSAPAHHRNRGMAEALHPRQIHDLQQAAHMQAGGSGIEPDVAGQFLGANRRFRPLGGIIQHPAPL